MVEKACAGYADKATLLTDTIRKVQIFQRSSFYIRIESDRAYRLSSIGCASCIKCSSENLRRELKGWLPPFTFFYGGLGCIPIRSNLELILTFFRLSRFGSPSSLFFPNRSLARKAGVLRCRTERPSLRCSI